MLKNKVVFITGGSRGIGRSIALTFAKQGASIVIAAKTADPHPHLKGTIYTVLEELEALGANALALQVDIRDEQQVHAAINKTMEHFGQIDILINNASAIALTPILNTSIKQFDLMQDVNIRGTFITSQACIPYLAKSDNPHILTLSPPLSMQAKWFNRRIAYTISKYSMSMCTLGLAEELKPQGIAVNSLWPKTTIATAAIEVNFPDKMYQASRKPEIVADAALAIVTQDSQHVTGNFFIDEDVLRRQGVDDFSDYALNPELPSFPDLYID